MHFFIKFHFAGDYTSGRKLAKQAEIESDIQSEGEYGRGHRRLVCVCVCVCVSDF